MQKNKAFKRVIKKLNAVRATLPNDEREVLDEIVAAPADENEVKAHRIATTKLAKAAVSGSKGSKKQVQGHRIATTKLAKAAVSGSKGSKKQVQGHRIATTKTNKAAISGSKKQVTGHRARKAKAAVSRNMKQTLSKRSAVTQSDAAAIPAQQIPENAANQD